MTSGIFKDIPRNELVIRVQPNESVYIKMNSKLPGLSMQTVVTELDLTYRRRFSDLATAKTEANLIVTKLANRESEVLKLSPDNVASASSVPAATPAPAPPPAK